MSEDLPPSAVLRQIADYAEQLENYHHRMRSALSFTIKGQVELMPAFTPDDMAEKVSKLKRATMLQLTRFNRMSDSYSAAAKAIIDERSLREKERLIREELRQALQLSEEI